MKSVNNANSIRPVMRPVLPLLAALILYACDQPPVKEIAAAEAALSQARAAGAERFAPERLREAENALREAQRKLQEKDYRGALSSATEAAEKSRSAAKAAGAAKTVARSAAELAQAEVRAAFEEVDAIREAATVAKVPDQAFEEVQPLVDQSRQALEGVAETLAQGDLLAAQKAAADLKVQVTPLPGLFRDAQDRWESAHPRARGRGAKPVPRKK